MTLEVKESMCRAHGQHRTRAHTMGRHPIPNHKPEVNQTPKTASCAFFLIAANSAKELSYRHMGNFILTKYGI